MKIRSLFFSFFDWALELWLRCCTSNAGDAGLITGWELRSHMLHGTAKILLMRTYCIAEGTLVSTI